MPQVRPNFVMSVTAAMSVPMVFFSASSLHRAGVFAAVLALAGCETLDPNGSKFGGPGDKPVQGAEPAVPSAAPRTTGVETRAATDQRYVINLFGGVYRSATAEAHLNGILAKLTASGDNPSEVYRVTLLNSQAVNAFALPSGDLFVTRGLLALANDSSEIAAVMAHEIGHVTARHAFQREEQQKLEALRANVANTVQNRQRGEEIKATGMLNLASFSRQQELEADRIGVSLVSKAGYDPYGASRFLLSLGRALEWRACQQDTARRDQSDIMSSHPSTPGRIQQAILAARQIGAPGIGAAGRNEYLDAIQGVDFGDDPNDGIVRGLTFSHLKFGFGFTAPEGFGIENCTQAVIGVTANKAEALRLDVVQLAGSTPAEEYIDSGWVEGLRKDTIQPRTIGGLNGAVAQAESNGWKFRVAAVKLGTEAVRVIFATRELTSELDAKFLRAIDSVHKLTPAETQRLRAGRIALVRPAAGDTADSLARRMSVSNRALELFLMLNGLQKGKPLDPGERYKIVQE